MVRNMAIPFLPEVKSVAVVGASRNREKWGYKVFKTVLDYQDIKAYPVNPNAKSIAGVKTHPTIKALPEIPDLVITVVPPKITEKIVKQAKSLGVKKIWFQPGSESQEAINMAKEANIEELHNVCMVVSSKKGEISKPEEPRTGT